MLPFRAPLQPDEKPEIVSSRRTALLKLQGPEGLVFAISLRRRRAMTNEIFLHYRLTRLLLVESDENGFRISRTVRNSARCASITTMSRVVGKLGNALVEKALSAAAAAELLTRAWNRLWLEIKFAKELYERALSCSKRQWLGLDLTVSWWKSLISLTTDEHFERGFRPLLREKRKLILQKLKVENSKSSNRSHSFYYFVFAASAAPKCRRKSRRIGTAQNSRRSLVCSNYRQRQ